MRRYRKHKRRWPAVLLTFVLLAGFAIFAFYAVRPDVRELSYPRKYASIVSAEAKTYGLEESLVYAVIKAESNFDAQAESSAGAIGLMQMMPETFYWMQTHVGETYDASALYEPEISIRFGCALLQLLLNEYDDLTVALCAYNAGMGNVASWLSDSAYSADGKTLQVIPFGETDAYVAKVLEYKETYEEIYYGGMKNV